jgi:hypothetical protein
MNPEKRENFDERLLAHIELAFSGRNSKPDYPGFPAIRRYIAKGTFYNQFQKKEQHIFCPECIETGGFSWMIREPSYDSFRGRHFKPGFFTSEENWENRLIYQSPDKTFPSSKK